MTDDQEYILTARHLNWSRKSTNILNDISLGIKRGEIVGIIGPNGAGKSSLLKVLGNIQAPDSGELCLDNQDFGSIKPRDFARRVSYLPQRQDIYWPLSVQHIIALGRIPHRNPLGQLADDDRAAIADAIEATGIFHLRMRNATQLSEGERMLVSLARILATNAELILADEPVASLDPAFQLRILKLLKEQTRSNRQHSVMLVLHDLNLAGRFCDRLIMLDRGKIIAEGEPASVLTDSLLELVYKVPFSVDPETCQVMAH